MRGGELRGEPLQCGWLLEPQVKMTLLRKRVSNGEEEVATHAGGLGVTLFLLTICPHKREITVLEFLPN